jgi:hypothetical protein
VSTSAAWQCGACDSKNVGAQSACLACGATRHVPCRSCGTPLPYADAGFCPKCGTPASMPVPAPRHCAGCYAVLSEEARFCAVCGMAARAPEQRQPQPERCANPSCGAQLDARAAFCSACGQPAKPAARRSGAAPPASRQGPCSNPACRKPLPSGARFCPYCGDGPVRAGSGSESEAASTAYSGVRESPAESPAPRRRIASGPTGAIAPCGVDSEHAPTDPTGTREAPVSQPGVRSHPAPEQEVLHGVRDGAVTDRS